MIPGSLCSYSLCSRAICCRGKSYCDLKLLLPSEHEYTQSLSVFLLPVDSHQLVLK